MPNRSSRQAHLHLLVAALAVLLAACGSAATPDPSSPAAGSPSAGASPSTGGSSAEPSRSPAASASADAGPTSAPSPSFGQTDTEWGRIWDAVPASFPVYPGSTTTEVGHAFSDERVVDGTVDAVTTWYQSALETAGYSTEALSGPLEDGSMVIDSVGEPLECRIQVRIGPLGELVLIDVLYGARCPSS